MNAIETREIVVFPYFFGTQNSGYGFRRAFRGLRGDRHGTAVLVFAPPNRAKDPWNPAGPAAIHLSCHASKTHVRSTTDLKFTHEFC
jgi:hypothetical protein